MLGREGFSWAEGGALGIVHDDVDATMLDDDGADRAVDRDLRGEVELDNAEVDAFFSRVNERVTGTVRLSLFKGSISVTGRKSPHSLLVPVNGMPAK